jgi:hypothetical protein
MSKVYFSCPKFTVLLVTRGPVIVTAAPIVKRFEGQTISTLTTWARSRFGGPIIVQKLRKLPSEDGKASPVSSEIDARVRPTGVRPVSDNEHQERQIKLNVPAIWRK